MYHQFPQLINIFFPNILNMELYLSKMVTSDISIRSLNTEVYIVFMIILILIYVYIREFHRLNQVHTMISWLYNISTLICEACHVHPEYQIRESQYLTFIDKSHHISMINLVLWNPLTNRLFDNNTLVYAIIHEITHILSPSSNHEPPFDALEVLLLNKAVELGYYDAQRSIDNNYMTLDVHFSPKG